MSDTLDVAIVGGGIAGMGTAWWLGKSAPDLNVKVFEADWQAGGKVRGETGDGTVFDWGPASFRSGAPALLELIDGLGLPDEVRYAQPAAKNRYLYVDGSLQAMPGSPPTLIKTKLLSPAAKLRGLLEPFVARHQGEETVHAFMSRRFGRQVADRLADAMVTGISASNSDEVSVDALFPRWRQLEQEHGSLIRGMIRSMRQAKDSGAAKPPSGQLSLRGGTQQLSATLAAALGDRLQAASEVARLERSDDAWQLQLADGRTVNARQVVLAVPAQVSAALLRGLAPVAAANLERVQYADVMVHSLIFNEQDLPQPLDGFGLLVGRGEQVRSLGIVWSSALFPDHTPAGTAHLHVMSGGRRDPGFIDLDDAAALAAVREDLRLSMGITAEPRAVWAHRVRNAIPQYETGHLDRMKEAAAELDRLGGLSLAGDVVAGIAVPACLEHAKKLAARLAARFNNQGAAG